MRTVRNATIDYMRGLAVVVMIFLHVSAFYLADKTTFFFWNYLHFVVPHFIFCSAFLEFSKGPKKIFINHLLKRARRLLLPYWLYVIFVFTIAFISTGKINAYALVNKLLLLQTNSQDYDWLVFLFICFAIIVPLVASLGRNLKLMLFVSISTLITAILFMFYDSPVPFRLMMWIPWTFFVMCVWWIVYFLPRFPTTPVIAIVVSLVTCLVTGAIMQGMNKSWILTQHKYPPDLFYLSYGSFWTFLSFYLFQKFQQFIPYWVDITLKFLSLHSYTIFFIHFFLLTYVLTFRSTYEVGVVTNTFVLLVTSIIVQKILIKVSQTFVRQPSGSKRAENLHR